uniref:Protein aurora borealis n=1 Tax=Ciona savignyi TaxID=51511 RepID=H2YQ07_CIOSA
MSSVQLMAEKNARLNNEKTPKCKMLGPSKSEHHFGMAQYSTPKSNLSDSGSMNTVNESIIANPFENRSIVDSLLQPSCSPSVNFSTSNSCLNKSPGSFWTIDQIAVLNPADIDLSKLHEQENFVKLDADSEIKAQRAIDDFFASTINITSPFSLPDKPHYVAIISPSPSMKRTTNLSQKRSESASKRVPSKIVEEEIQDVEVRNKITTSTQTALTIP